MISLEKITFAYPGVEEPALKDFDFRVKALSRVAITGPVGGGKTTLSRLMAGLLRPASGSVHVAVSPARGGIPVAYLGGDPADSLVGASVEEDVAFGLENLGAPAHEIKARLEEALAWTGLSGMEARLTHTLSGGEQQKLALASALALDAEVLILDEALRMLDRPARRSARELIDSLRKHRGVTVVEVTHQFEDTLAADRLVFLAHGRIEFDGPPAGFLATPLGQRWARMSGGLPGLLAALNSKGIIPSGSTGLQDPYQALRDLLVSYATR